MAIHPPSYNVRCHSRAISRHIGSSLRFQQRSRRHAAGTLAASQARASAAKASSDSENEKSMRRPV